MNVGVLSYQGSVAEHINTLNTIKGVNAFGVKYLPALEKCDALIMPGGESTAIAKLLKGFGLFEPLKKRIADGMPVWGTCAGMILLASKIDGEKPHLEAMDISVKRNAYGSQLFSFAEKTLIPVLNKKIETVFIRAPIIEKVGKNVDVLLELDGKIVAARQGNMLATSFHPELTDDNTFHKYFLSFLDNDKSDNGKRK